MAIDDTTKKPDSSRLFGYLKQWQDYRYLRNGFLFTFIDSLENVVFKMAKGLCLCCGTGTEVRKSIEMWKEQRQRLKISRLSGVIRY